MIKIEPCMPTATRHVDRIAICSRKVMDSMRTTTVLALYSFVRARRKDT
jgi:hypothetical protein